MKNRFFRYTLKILIAVVSFLLIFFFIQPLFVPKYYGDSTDRVNGYSYLEQNSIDVLFLGASQMFCTIDAGKLTDEYGISSYDFGSNSQNMPITEYYCREALKTQSPKIVMLEISMVFSSNDEVGNDALSWNYSPMPITFSKLLSAYQVCNHDLIKAVDYSYTPLFLYHDRWSSIDKTDIDYYCNPEGFIDSKSRGFLARDHVEPHEIEYFNDNEVTLVAIPQESETAILDIAEICNSRQIKLILFKSPVSNWTKGKSQSVMAFAEENNIEFIDLNDKIEEIGIDENKDFYNDTHLNEWGAAKTTDYLAKTIPLYLEAS